MSDQPRVPITERGGKTFPFGTVYYSREQNAFLAAGREGEGPLSVGEVSGRVSYSVSNTGVARFRDETGQFIRTGSFLASSGVQFGHGLINIHEVKSHPDIGTPAGPDSQWVERTTLLLPNGKVKVVEINHGIGGDFEPQKQGKQWWRKVRDALTEEGKKAPTYNEVKAAIQSRETLLRINLGPLGQGE